MYLFCHNSVPKECTQVILIADTFGSYFFSLCKCIIASVVVISKPMNIITPPPNQSKLRNLSMLMSMQAKSFLCTFSMNSYHQWENLSKTELTGGFRSWITKIHSNPLNYWAHAVFAPLWGKFKSLPFDALDRIRFDENDRNLFGHSKIAINLQISNSFHQPNDTFLA